MWSYGALRRAGGFEGGYEVASSRGPLTCVLTRLLFFPIISFFSFWKKKFVVVVPVFCSCCSYCLEAGSHFVAQNNLELTCSPGLP